MDKIGEKIRRFIGNRQRNAELRKLRASGEFDKTLRDVDYELLPGDQGSDFVNVYRKGNVALGSELFSALASKEEEEAIWWIVQRHREEANRNL